MTLLEMKQALSVLRAEVIALRDRVGALEAAKAPDVVMTVRPEALAAVKEFAEAKTARGLCPKCNKKPNHFFHVRTCKG